MTIDTEPLLTRAEVAALFGVQGSRIGAWTNSGLIPARAVVTTPGGARRWRESVIRELREQAEEWAP